MLLSLKSEFNDIERLTSLYILTLTIRDSYIPKSFDSSTTMKSELEDTQSLFCTSSSISKCSAISNYQYLPSNDTVRYYQSFGEQYFAFISNYYNVLDGSKKLVADKELVTQLFDISDLLLSNNATFNFMTDYLNKTQSDSIVLYSTINVNLLHRPYSTTLDSPLYYICFPFPSINETAFSQNNVIEFLTNFSQISAAASHLNVSLLINNNSWLISHCYFLFRLHEHLPTLFLSFLKYLTLISLQCFSVFF